MDKKIISNIFAAWQEVTEKKKLDPVDSKELKGKHADRDDKDIDNDGDTDSSDEYLHKRRKAISKNMKKEEACPKCDGNGCDECEDGMDEGCGKKMHKKEAVRHEDHGYGEIIAESDEGVDVLFAHGVEFNVPAEQLEGVSSNIKTAKRMGGNMTGAVKKIDKTKKGASDHPKVQKALRKANEENELEEKLEKERVKHPNGQRPKGPGWSLKKAGEQSGKDHSEWERKVKRVESTNEGTVAEVEEVIKDAYADRMSSVVEKLQRMWEKASVGSAGKPSESMLDQYKGKGAKDMAKDHGADKPTHADVPEVSQAQDDVAKAGRATKAAPARGAADNLSNGEKKIVKGGK